MNEIVTETNDDVDKKKQKKKRYGAVSLWKKCNHFWSNKKFGDNPGAQYTRALVNK